MRILCALALAGLVAACASSPPVRFYALAGPAPAAGARELPGPSVAVGPVTIPDALDRPQLVTRRGAGEVRIEEFARWAGPLRAEIAQAVTAQLAALRPDARVATSAAAPAMPDFRVTVDVQRFELAPGESTTLEAVWSVTAGARTLRTARAVIAERVEASGFEALVAAQSRAIERLARDIAAALPQQ